MTTKIIGTGSYAPETIVTNDDLSRVVETNDEWIRSRTGIHERRIATDIGTTGMAVRAAKKAMENAGVSAGELEIIIVGTSSAEFLFPNCACEVQAALGADRAVAFDVSAACSGFSFALNTVHGFISSGIYRTGLIIGVDAVSKLMDWTDRGTCVLFGDGAGAAVVRPGDTGILHMMMRSDGKKGDALRCQSRSMDNFLTGGKPHLGFTSMDGQEIFKFAVKKVPESILQVLEESHTDIEEIKYFILHQANSRIFDSIAKRLRQPLEKFPMNIERYGNTSAASVPLILDEMNQDGRLKPGDKVIIAGFGGGLTWAVTLMEW